MKGCVVFFFKVMFVIWWIILGTSLTVIHFCINNTYIALLSLFMLTVWVSLSWTAIVYLNNKDHIGKQGDNR